MPWYVWAISGYLVVSAIVGPIVALIMREENPEIPEDIKVRNMDDMDA